MNKKPIEIISQKIKEQQELLNKAVKESNSVAQSVLTTKISALQMEMHSFYGKTKEPDTKINEIS